MPIIPHTSLTNMLEKQSFVREGKEDIDMKQSVRIGIILVLLVVVGTVNMMMRGGGWGSSRGRYATSDTHGTCQEYGHSKCYDCQSRTASAIEYQLGFPPPSPKMGHV